MRRPMYAVAIGLGAVLALLGSRPLWIPAVLALLAFPLAASVADRRSREQRASSRAPLPAAAVTPIAGGLLTALAIRLALDAPGWLSGPAADCGGPSTATQQVVLWGAAMIFAFATLPVAMTLLNIGQRVGVGDHDLSAPPPLSLYPVAVAASGLALVAAGYVTSC